MRVNIFSTSIELVALFLLSSCNGGDDGLGGSKPEKSSGVISLELRSQHHEGGVTRVTGYLRNNGTGSVVVATSPLEPSEDLVILENREDKRILLMLSVIPPAGTLAEEVFRDRDLGEVTLNGGEVFKLFVHDLDGDKYEGWVIDAHYVSFPDEKYRSFWSGESNAKLSIGSQ